MSFGHYLGLVLLTITILVLFVPITVYLCAKLWSYGTLKGKRLFDQRYPKKEEYCDGSQQT